MKTYVIWNNTDCGFVESSNGTITQDIDGALHFASMNDANDALEKCDGDCIILEWK